MRFSPVWTLTKRLPTGVIVEVSNDFLLVIGGVRKARNRVGINFNTFTTMAQNNAILNEIQARLDVTEERPHWCDTD